MTSFNIYNFATQKQIDNFKPTFLYIKQHSVTGKLYFGKTVKTDPVKYPGSGTYWTKHTQKYGKECVETLWFCLFTDIYSLVNFAKTFCIINNIGAGDTTVWANQIPEDGIGQSGVRTPRPSLTKRNKSEKGRETSRKVGLKNKGRKHSDESRKNMGNSHIGSKRSDEVKEKMRMSAIAYENSPEGKNKRKLKAEKQMKKVLINGVIFNSIKEAVLNTGISAYFIRKNKLILQ